ncbi:MAG: cytochrome c oxidase subunit II [Hyphomonadaceae bacterium]|nr:cytochrome c oxidase subunit II [Hyphomonadaceae bacterium]
MIAGLTASVVSLAGTAHAAVGAPTPQGLDLQAPATGIMSQIHDFHSFLLTIIVAITLFVLALLLWVIVRYNRRANPTPRKFTHNMLVEVIWTIVPVLILVAIAWKSFPLLYAQERIPEDAEITLKVTGNSWFWNFEYPDQGVAITANLLPEDEARAQNRPYLLATTEPLLVPADTTVRVLVTSNDVIHSFGVPAFGVKEDAIQGRVNEGWFNVDSSMVPVGSVIYGQCYELCGVNHAYMPIEIHVVSRADWEQWITAQGGALPAPEGAAPSQAPAQPSAPAAQPTR